MSDSKGRILVVEDAKFLREHLTKLLTEKHYEVIMAEDGKEGVEMYKKFKPDLVTMDINMPVMNGVEALQKIIKLNKDARVIMISNEDDYEIIDDCKKFGALQYIIKPFSEDVILQAVHMALHDVR